MNRTTLLHYTVATCLACCAAASAESIPPQVRIDGLFVEFDRKTVEKIIMSGSGTAPATEALLANWRKGKGRLLQACRLLTRSGVCASAEAVDEIIYPIEYRVSQPPEGAAAGGEILYPESFETREVGAQLQIVPTVGPARTLIDLTVTMEVCASRDWQELTATARTPSNDKFQTTVRQPVFTSRNLSTSLLARDGATVVLGGLTDRESDEVLFLFLTATVVDASGKPVAGAP